MRDELGELSNNEPITFKQDAKLKNWNLCHNK